MSKRNVSVQDDITIRRLRNARRRSKRKAAKINAKTRAEIPLFADQVEPATPQTLFEKWRAAKARNAEGHVGHGLSAEMLWENWEIGVLRRIAAELLPAEDFAALASKRWVGYPRQFWIDALTTCKPVTLTHNIGRELGPIPVYRRDADGQRIPGTCYLVLSDRAVMDERSTWPPPGWTPPLTRERLDEMLRIPDPIGGLEDDALPFMGPSGPLTAKPRPTEE